MAFVSIYTVGRLNHPHSHSASREFFQVGNEVYRQATKSGLIEAFSPEGVSFPEDTVKGKGSPILTLTVWRSLQSLYRFTYSGKHMQALHDRSRWIESYPEKHPSYVVWWTEMVRDVSWEEAFRRYNHYIQHGSTPYAFDFKNAFDEKGETLLIK
ncbi:DUF3291 domain-containing protein [Bacillus salipaludis]|uniref:DUF3291 domain-containing protein n=1 Tax=Bacillus salipaludis TaxID=2547811 RepID=A0A4R5VMU1_9BACI|nr:DUF3291 domain-containing protein [Bacillus salipaludis]MDQ6598241.1 DUF3291 domain-containing protein [Bacillus salipaludis]TDK59383.1 DUF3291 domain-containing protein [Bacillus salipaludis]